VEDKQLALKQQLVTVVQGPSADDERRKPRPVAQIITHLRQEETKISPRVRTAARCGHK